MQGIEERQPEEVEWIFRAAPWILGGGFLLFLAGGLVGLGMRRLLGRPLRAGGSGAGDPGGFVEGLQLTAVWLRNWLALALAGGVAGGLLYLAAGPWLAPGLGWGELGKKGAANGAFFLGLVWGPGLALVSLFFPPPRGGRQAGAREGRA